MRYSYWKPRTRSWQDKLWSFNDNDSRINEIEGNFTKVSFSRAKYERFLNPKFDDIEEKYINDSDDIKIEVRYLSVTLMNLNKHTMEMNGSIPNLIESKFTKYSIIVKRSVSDINKLITSADYQVQLVYNPSALGNDQSNFNIFLKRWFILKRDYLCFYIFIVQFILFKLGVYFPLC